MSAADAVAAYRDLLARSGAELVEFGIGAGAGTSCRRDADDLPRDDGGTRPASPRPGAAHQAATSARRPLADAVREAVAAASAPVAGHGARG